MLKENRKYNATKIWYEYPMMNTPEQPTRSRERNPVVDVIINISTASTFIKAKLDEACSPLGLTGAQYNLLRVLHHSGKPELTHSELVQRIVEKSVDVTRAINNMIKLGFVTRRSDNHDRRVALHAITEDGVKALHEIDMRFRGLVIALSSAFSAEELQAFSSLCQRLYSVHVPALDGEIGSAS
jgi:DNA-binding MarR family transcriptional regulator